METLWTLHVENFAGIERADIDVSPLTLFVGDNNSGKSYLLALIYGLMRTDENGALSNLCEDSAEYQACAEWAEQAIGEDCTEDIERPFDDYAYSLFENLWNRILESNQESILQSIFHENIFSGKIGLKFQGGNEESLRISFHRSRFAIGFSISPNHSLFHLTGFDPRSQQACTSVIFYTLEFMITRLRFSKNHIFFLPTARTGFLLTYPALTKDAFSRAYYNPTESDLSLSRPCVDFLKNLATVHNANLAQVYPHRPIVQFIEKNILKGKVLVSNKLPLPVFSYRQKTMKADISMSLSSDVVKEITPLVLTLQYQNADALFIEEPEMNLHPQLQQMMARVMVKLVNAGTPVFAATHSDTILQHVNNMVKLNNLPKKRQATLKKRFGFDKDDLISADKISMYQFDVQDNGKTVVQALKCGDYGFEVPTFYDPLETLLEQTRATEPDAEEYED